LRQVAFGSNPTPSASVVLSNTVPGVPGAVPRSLRRNQPSPVEMAGDHVGVLHGHLDRAKSEDRL
jgi:hypothetical protein